MKRLTRAILTVESQGNTLVEKVNDPGGPRLSHVRADEGGVRFVFEDGSFIDLSASPITQEEKE